MEFHLRAAVLLSRINEWSSKEHWEHCFCEQKKLRTLQSQAPTEPAQWQWIERTKFLTLTKVSKKTAFSMTCCFHHLTTSFVSSQVGPTADPVSPSGHNVASVFTKDGNAAWNTKTRSVKFLTNRQPSIYDLGLCTRQAGKDLSKKYQYPNCKWNSRVHISQMAVPKKSTQVANICKPNLLPVTFFFYSTSLQRDRNV